MRFGGRAYRIEDVEQIGSLGLDFAEINFPEGKNRACQAQDWLGRARRWNLGYLVHAPKEGNPYDIPQLEGRFCQEILRSLDACRELSAPLLTIHFWMDARFIPENVWNRKREILWTMAQEGQRRGVQLCLENLSERPEDIQPLLTGCPELGLTLDIGHGQLLSRQNWSLDFLARWPERIHHVHAHDNRGGDRVEDDLHLPIGDGEIDFASIFQSLVRVGYRGTVTLEVPHPQLALSVQRLRQMVESCLHSLGEGLI